MSFASQKNVLFTTYITDTVFICVKPRAFSHCFNYYFVLGTRPRFIFNIKLVREAVGALSNLFYSVTCYSVLQNKSFINSNAIYVRGRQLFVLPMYTAVELGIPKNR